MSDLARLIELCPPPSTRSLSVAGAPDADAGALPVSHRELTQTYGAGCFDEFLCIYSEDSANPYLNVLSRSKATRVILRGKDDPNFLATLERYGASVDDLIQWGVTEGADLFMWIAVGPPDQWCTLAAEAGLLRFVVLPQSSTSIILGLISGELHLDFMPDDFPSSEPQFIADGRN